MIEKVMVKFITKIWKNKYFIVCTTTIAKNVLLVKKFRKYNMKPFPFLVANPS